MRNYTKKIFYAAVALLCSTNAVALDYEPEEGVTAMAYLGMNVSNNLGMNVSDIRKSYMDAKLGGTIGLKLDFMLPEAHGTYITTGLGWTIKGSKAKGILNANQQIDATLKHRLNYLEVPVRVGFRYNVDRYLGFYGEVGPYFAVGVAGKCDILHIDRDGSEWTKLEEVSVHNAFKSDTQRTNFQRWDCGLGFRVGLECNQHYNFMLGCDWGLTDMYRNKYRDAMADSGHPLGKKVRNFNFTLAFGYRF